MLTDAMKEFMNAGENARPAMVNTRVAEFLTATLAPNEAITEERFFEVLGADEKAKNVSEIKSIADFYAVRNAVVNQFGTPSTGTTAPLAPQAAATTVAASQSAADAGLSAGFGFAAPAAETVAASAAETPTRRPAAKSRADVLAAATTPATQAPEPQAVEAELVDTPAAVQAPAEEVEPEVIETTAEEVVEEAPAPTAGFGGSLPTPQVTTEQVNAIVELSEAVETPAPEEVAPHTPVEEVAAQATTPVTETPAETTTKKRNARKAEPVSDLDAVIQNLIDRLKATEKELEKANKAVDAERAKVTKLEADLAAAKSTPATPVLSSKTLKALAEYGAPVAAGTDSAEG